MSKLMNIHPIVQEEIRKYFDLKPVQLKHPLPERPVRALGLMDIDGEVFSSDRLLRAVFIRPQLPVYFAVRSMFLRPRVEYDLPVTDDVQSASLVHRTDVRYTGLILQLRRLQVLYL